MDHLQQLTHQFLQLQGKVERKRAQSKLSPNAFASIILEE